MNRAFELERMCLLCTRGIYSSSLSHVCRKGILEVREMAVVAWRWGGGDENCLLKKRIKNLLIKGLFSQLTGGKAKRREKLLFKN